MSARLTRRGLLGGLAAVPMATALVGCSSNTGASAEDGFAAGDGTVTLIAPGKRVKAGAISGKTLDGKNISLADYSGKVVVLNVWASWCSPCRHEAPALVEASTKLKGKAQFIGLNTRDSSQQTAQAFVRTAKIPYPSIWDQDGSVLLALNAVPAKAIPSTLVLDTQGRIAARVLGEVNGDTLVAMVTDVINGK